MRKCSKNIFEIFQKPDASRQMNHIGSAFAPSNKYFIVRVTGRRENEPEKQEEK